MNRTSSAILAFIATIVFVGTGNAQADEICSKSSGTPTLGESRGLTPYLYGKVILSGFDPDSKLPKVTIGMTERSQPEKRLVLDDTGNYCFRRTNAETAAVLSVYLEGLEVARKSIYSLGPAQQREDFEISTAASKRKSPPGTVSAKYSYPPNEKTDELYKKALEAEMDKDQGKLVKYVKEIVSIDPADFVAWAKLGSIYIEQKSFPEAESALRKSLDLKPVYVPAMINLGRVYLAQVQSERAVEVLKKATATDPKSALAFRFLGQAYLQAKKGALGVEALKKALERDPIGMADAHLLMAVLYDRAGAKDLASREYKIFLTKVPNHPDKKKFEKYIKDNPE